MYHVRVTMSHMYSEFAFNRIIIYREKTLSLTEMPPAEYTMPLLFVLIFYVQIYIINIYIRLFSSFSGFFFSAEDNIKNTIIIIWRDVYVSRIHKSYSPPKFTIRKYISNTMSLLYNFL